VLAMRPEVLTSFLRFIGKVFTELLSEGRLSRLQARSRPQRRSDGRTENFIHDKYRDRDTRHVV